MLACLLHRAAATKNMTKLNQQKMGEKLFTYICMDFKYNILGADGRRDGGTEERKKRIQQAANKTAKTSTTKNSSSKTMNYINNQNGVARKASVAKTIREQ